MVKQLVILSGPSCAGKTPLLKAVRRLRPDLAMAMPVLYTSRPPRPGEQEGVDYYYRSKEEICALPATRYLVGQVRVIWQAVDLQQIAALFEKESLIVLEIYPTLGRLFLDHPAVQQASAAFRLRTVFLCPVLEEEIQAVQGHMGYESPQQATSAIMLPKLIRRSQQQGKVLSSAEVNDLQTRANRAYDEIQMAKNYQEILVNHDGEDSPHWGYSPPLGEAGRTVARFIKILEGDD
ncbi:MAG: Guanylate kinase [bacterium ADurb.Bin478]|nr:MAG: Guanylate kinase [bacterium ADurb.Bin478]